MCWQWKSDYQAGCQESADFVAVAAASTREMDSEVAWAARTGLLVTAR